MSGTALDTLVKYERIMVTILMKYKFVECYHFPETILRIFHLFTFLKNVMKSGNFCFHFRDDNTETQRA